MPMGYGWRSRGQAGFAGVVLEGGSMGVCRVAVQFGVGGGGFLQVAAEGFFDGGQAAAGAFDLLFKGFFVARQLVFADKRRGRRRLG